MSLSVHESPLDDYTRLPNLLRPTMWRACWRCRGLGFTKRRERDASRRCGWGGDDGPLRLVASDLERWLADARATWCPGRSRSAAPPQVESPASVVPIRGQESLL